MCSYWDAVEEGRWVFLKKLASSSSFLQENGSHYRVHYMLCCVSGTKECLEPEGKGRWREDPEQWLSVIAWLMTEVRVENHLQPPKHLDWFKTLSRGSGVTHKQGQMLPADNLILTLKNSEMCWMYHLCTILPEWSEMASLYSVYSVFPQKFILTQSYWK